MAQSLFRHLLAWTLGALFVVWAAFMYFGYSTGVHEADELTDGHLASVAAVLLSQQAPAQASDARSASKIAATDGLAELKAHDYQQSLSIVVWDAAGNIVSHSGEASAPPFTASEGFEKIVLGEPPVTWRTFSRWNGPEHARKVTVMLSLQERDGLADDIAEQVARPGLWLLPVVALVLIFAIRKGLRPLLDLSEQVNQLDVHRDTSLKAPPHEEFKAIVLSIETLIGRYNAALRREREFASEVAHELRTPLASLRLHAALLQHEMSAQELAFARKQIDADAERAAAVLTDLLALARASRAELAEAQEPVDLSELAASVAAEYGQAALESGHELSVEAPQPCAINGHPVILAVALRNLIENALAHTPPGSAVRVRVQREPPRLEVIDNGAAVDRNPGAMPVRKHLGLGLGHQVVGRVAEIHDGYFEAVDLPGAGGRCYRMVFAAAGAPEALDAPSPYAASSVSRGAVRAARGDDNDPAHQ
ncbi:MAG TPA: histidine kinase dimerization/phospho-acceptor domain-containing protein [Ramlibacter sp.]|nr:histidine kinase dimerization/phospho-acceptor domain-containing protein [Ramlibacter sp.]